MMTYYDKTHRVKKTKNGYLPQWKAGFLCWKPYRLMVADTAFAHWRIYSEWREPPVFETESYALGFLKKVAATAHKDVYYKGYDELLPGLKCD